MSKLRIAIIGCGGMARAHAHRFHHNKDVQIVALCDVSEPLLERFRNEHLRDYHPAPRLYTDAAAMYRDAHPDAVAIVTPHTLHFQQGVQALDAGCHVLMEKPMVTSVDQARKLADKAKHSGKVFAIAYNTPCTPEFDFIRRTIRERTLGRLELVSGYLCQDWQKMTAGTWRQDPALSGGGQAYDSGAHLLNSVCWSVESEIAEVFAFVDKHGAAVDINSSINVRFQNGVLASLLVGGNCPAEGTALHFIFDGGRIETDGWGGSWINVWRSWQRWKYPQITGEPQTPNDNFIDAILGRAETRTSPRDGLVQCQLMDAIYESARSGQPVRPGRL